MKLTRSALTHSTLTDSLVPSLDQTPAPDPEPDPEPDPVGYTAIMSQWNGTSVPFGEDGLIQVTPSLTPMLSGSSLVFDRDVIVSEETALMDIFLSQNWEVSVAYTPNSIGYGFIWIAGDRSQDGDNCIQLQTLATGEYRLHIDGNVGAWSRSFDSTGSPPAAVGVTQLITVMSVNGEIDFRVDGDLYRTGVPMTGNWPDLLDVFAVGARIGTVTNAYVNGSVDYLEVVSSDLDRVSSGARDAQRMATYIPAS